jgi:hypothetical protein
MYNNNEKLVSNVVKVTTEEILQVGNPGFEEYQTTTMHVSPAGWIYDYDREWYLPYKQGETDTWWAVNSKKTMPDGHTAWTSNFCKNFPCTAYSTVSYSGEKSAMVYSINVSDGNTDGTAIGDTVPGEIWIGKADDSGNHSADGHAFANRPSALKFMYRYADVNNENFSVTIVMYGGGKEIARTEVIDGAAASEWKERVVPIVYSDLMTKADKIYISFKSAVPDASNKVQVRTAVSMEIAGQNRTAHIGSALRIDDIQLIYE